MDKKKLDLIKRIAIIIVLGCLALHFRFNEEQVFDDYSEVTGVVSEVNADSTETVTNTEQAGHTESISDVKSEDKIETVDIIYKFRNKNLLAEHFEKHGEEFPYKTKEEYLEGANIMMSNPNKLHKIEKEDGDDVYYLESTNEFIIVSKDGYLRTYFKPSRGKAYFDKQ